MNRIIETFRPFTRFAVLVVAIAVFLDIANVSYRTKRISAEAPKRPELARWSGEPAVSAKSADFPWVNVTNFTEIRTEFVGDTEFSTGLETGRSHALSLAAADFDEDGTPDIVAGYGEDEGGMISLMIGNVDAIYPNNPEAIARKEKGEFTDTPFLSPARLFAIPTAPDFLAAGDFDADGHFDIAAAARDQSVLCFVQGDGHGHFNPLKRIELPGTVTALLGDDIDRRDGLADLIVSIENERQGQILIFEDPYGAAKARPENFTFNAPVNSLATGFIEGDSSVDLAIAAGHELIILQGRDRKLLIDKSGNTAAEAQFTSYRFDYEIMSLAVGDFLKGETYETELALLGDDGEVHLLKNIADKPLSGKASADWLEKAAVTLPKSASRVVEKSFMLSARVSARPVDTLVVGSGSKQLHLLTSDVAPTQYQSTPAKYDKQQFRLMASMDAASEPTAILPMRLNPDALSDLAVLRKGSASLAVVHTAPMALFVVNSSSNAPDCDLSDGACLIEPRINNVCTGPCTLRSAIAQANNLGGASDIRFNIQEPGVPTITAVSVHYGLNVPMIIDGTTQPGGRVQLTGPPGLALSRFIVSSDNNVIRGFVMNGNSGGYFIDLRSGNNRVEGNRLGTNVDGTAALGGSGGVTVSGSYNQIGGTTPFARNLISSGDIINLAAVDLQGGIPFGNRVMGNYIGTDAAGNSALGNKLAGINVNQFNATIGGTQAGAGNVISGVIGSGSTVYDSGIVIGIPGTDILIQGNKIGTNAGGTAALPNARHGITNISGASGQTISGNLISSNTLNGVNLQINAADPVNYVVGNYIGTNLSGDAALGNGGLGVLLGGRFGVANSNLVSGNALGGMQINQNSADFGNVTYNLIGTNAANTAPLGNGGVGLFMNNPDRVSILGNTIAASNGHGLVLTNSSRNLIGGNYIGTNPSLIASYGNNGDGIRLDGGSSANNSIGSSLIAGENVVAFNTGAGVNILPSTGAVNNEMRRNLIMGNGGLGIDLANNGVTNNDNCDSDVGANGLQNHPTLTSAVPYGRTIRISGTLNSLNRTFLLDFYENSAADPTGYGEGAQFIGSTTVFVPTTCVGLFTVDFPSRSSTTNCVSATATDPIGNTSEFSPCIPIRRNRAPYDFDGDGRTDVSVWRPSEGIWYIIKSSGSNQITQWGTPTDLITPGDFDGDGKTEIAVWRPSSGTWYILSSDGTTYTQYSWGLPTDIPVVGDYDGDGKADVAVWRPSEGNWYLLKSSGGTQVSQWGLTGDVPAAGDFDGDGQTDFSIWRRSSSVWYVYRSTEGFFAIQWGIPSDRPVPADYDGDGKDDIAVWRPSEGVWYIVKSSDSSPIFVQWGLSTDVPVPGDYDGDGRADIAVYRGGTWYVLSSSSGNYNAYYWGLPNDTAIPSVSVR